MALTEATPPALGELRQAVRGRVIDQTDLDYDAARSVVHAAYPGSTWQRLAEIKARHDPDNVFHRNQNVEPAAR